MGWSNYIIIDNWKILIETHREVEDIEDYLEKAINNMINAENDQYCEDEECFIEMDNVKINEITIGNLTSLFKAYKNANDIVQMSIDKFLLYWLKNRDIEYEVKSEHSINIEEYKNNGYIIISR